MADDLASVVAAAKKILGDDPKLPKLPGSYDKADADVDAKFKAFDKDRDTLKASILDLHKAAFGLAQAIEDYGGLVAKSDLGLDTKDPEYKKKRAAAQKLFDAWFGKQEKTMVDNAAKVIELAKHLADISAYKSPPAPNL